LPVWLSAGENVHLASLITRQLKNQMRGGAEAKESEALAATYFAQTIRTIPDDAGAE
jgi:hypothetical protein